MVQGRKKRGCKKDRRSFNCSDMVAWNLCKQKKVKISSHLTRIIRILGYKPSTNNQHDINCLRNFMLMQIEAIYLEEEHAVLQLQAKYAAERKFVGKQLNKLADLEMEFQTKQLEESMQPIVGKKRKSQ